MNQTNQDVQKLIESHARQVKKKNIGIDKIDVSLDRDKKGKYLTKLKVFIRGKILRLEGENYNLNQSIKKSFHKLNMLLEKKKHRRYPKTSFNFGEVA